jgi:hypothetical protein
LGISRSNRIQDAHNEAWILACLLGGEEALRTYDNERTENTPKSSRMSAELHGFFKKYELESRPSASQNAALRERQQKREDDGKIGRST